MVRLMLLALLLGACDGTDGDIDYIDSEDVCDVAHDAATADRDRDDCVNPDTFLPPEVREADQATWFACYVEWREAEESACWDMTEGTWDVDEDCVSGIQAAQADAGSSGQCSGHQRIEDDGVVDVRVWTACYLRYRDKFGQDCPIP